MKIFVDVECYRNYFLVLMMTEKGNTIAFEMYEGKPLEIEALSRILDNKAYEFITFNGNGYDIPMISYALTAEYNQLTCADLKGASDAIINDELTPWNFEKKYKIKLIRPNHVDLIEPSPGVIVGLKIYGGRLHVKKMQDLPFDPDETLTSEQIAEIRSYCRNDLLVTQALYDAVKGRIDLRRAMSAEYSVDLRSKSDAQIAEAVLKAEVTRLEGTVPKKIQVNYREFKYVAPAYIAFRTKQLQDVLELVTTTNLIIGKAGYVELPDEIAKMVIKLGNTNYQIGMGGLHSQEKSVSYFSDDQYMINDNDVVSYYPSLMLNLEMWPESIGPSFLPIFKKILDERVVAKHTGNKIKNEGLKIVLNGTFGKTSSKYSILYNPVMTIQTTLTGQLSLLMLIEFFELYGISVVSANTDGVVTRCHATRRDAMRKIIAAWEKRTNLATEETSYRSIHSRDVNNYIAVKMDGSVKTKGIFAETSLMKTPQNEICSSAVAEYLSKGTPIEVTVRGCRDIRQFVTVRRVTGGAEKDGVVLGKVIRWYYATDTTGLIRYVKSGNSVPRTSGAKPLMELPDEFPDDVNYEWYESECNEMLMDVGVLERPVIEKIPRKNTKVWKDLLARGLIFIDELGKAQWQK